MKKRNNGFIFKNFIVLLIVSVFSVLLALGVRKMCVNNTQSEFVDDSLLNLSIKEFLSASGSRCTKDNLKFTISFKNGNLVSIKGVNVDENGNIINCSDIPLLAEAIAPSESRNNLPVLVEDINNLNYSFNDTSEYKNQNGLYRSSKTNNGKSTYYFRGNITNNYVQFGEENGNPILWRVVRINEDGTIRLVKETNINDYYTYRFYPNSYSDTEGMYYTKTNVTNTSTSEDGAMKTLEKWYSDNLSEYDNYIVQSTFCEEPRVYYDYDKTNLPDVTFTPYSQYEIKFSCQTAIGTTYGVVNSKIGLLSYDEVVFAGGCRNSNNGDGNYYLINGTSYWLISPAGPSLTTTYPHTWKVTNTGNLDYSYIDSSYYLRPVISLKADTIYTLLETGTGEEGSITNPYVVE